MVLNPQPQQSGKETQDQHGKFDYWIKVIIGLCVLVIAFDLSFIALSSKLFSKKDQTQTLPNKASVVSGVLDINGYLPDDTVVEIQQRLMGETTFRTVETLSHPIDGVAWNWETAEEGSTYELKAVAKSAGSIIAESLTLAVTAPADSEILRIVSTAVASGQAGSDPTTNVFQSTLSGKVEINGYIPTGATVTIQAKKQGESTTTPIITNLKAADGVAWAWNTAQTGVLYELQAILLSGSTQIGISPTLTTAAPGNDEILAVTSKATAPVSQDPLSGTININGPIPAGATVTISVRKSGTPQFTTAISGLSARDGISWHIPNLQTGISYDVLAYLLVNNTIQTQSQLLVVTPPAHHEVLTINVASRPSAPPSSSITFNCPGKNNSNQWQVAIQYNQNNVNPNAKAFILQLGTNSGSSDIFSIQSAPNNPEQMQTYTSNFILNEGQTYFAQYAYTTCQSCTDLGFYSQFTTPIQVRCVTAPTNTPTTTPTNTPVPTNTPTNTVTPTVTSTPTTTPSPTPKISQCNESCGGSSGYTCTGDLTCFDPSPGVIGGDVCRNPSCTDKENCTCD